MLGIGRHRDTCVEIHRLAETVRETSPQFYPPHTGQTALGVCLSPEEDKHCRNYDKHVLFHGHFTLSSLMTFARTMSSFSTVNDW